MTYQDYFFYSLFANFAYVSWNDSWGDSTRPSSESLTDAAADDDVWRLPSSLGNKIFTTDGWSVPSLAEGGFFSDEETGFAAYLFTNSTQDEKVLAIRGTQPNELVLDLFRADLLEIGLLGVSLSQAVSLFNYISRLSSPAGQDVVQLRLGTGSVPPPNKLVDNIKFSHDGKTQYYWLETADFATGLGQISAGDKVTITGHSLGGHLAAFALRMFPQLLDSAVAFNAPGFDPLTANDSPSLITSLISLAGGPARESMQIIGSVAQQLTDEVLFPLFAPHLSTPAAGDFDQVADRIAWIKSEDSVAGEDFDLVAGPFTGLQPSATIRVRTEQNAHSMNQVMDSLALHALIEKMSNGEAASSYFSVFDAVSNFPSFSLESYVAALAKVISPSAAYQSVPVTYTVDFLDYPGDQEAFDLRSALHDAIITMDDALSGSASGAKFINWFVSGIRGRISERLRGC